MIDTLRLARRLTDAGMDRKAAEVLADELNEGFKESAVTKSGLDAALSKLKTELIVWQVGIGFAVVGVLKYLK
jgi:hypothetical protein